jgi:hypothetical protein
MKSFGHESLFQIEWRNIVISFVKKKIAISQNEKEFQINNNFASQGKDLMWIGFPIHVPNSFIRQCHALNRKYHSTFSREFSDRNENLKLIFS